MGFLRRLLGGGDRAAEDESADVDAVGDGDDAPFDRGQLDAAERAHELEVLRAEQERLDELTQRQLRYASYAWQPPAQGGDRRADDGERQD
jgi:hypothetical protein